MFSIFPKFQAMDEQQFNLKIKSVQTDWGGEYRKIHNFFGQLGIFHGLSWPYTDEQNGSV